MFFIEFMELKMQEKKNVIEVTGSQMLSLDEGQFTWFLLVHAN